MPRFVAIHASPAPQGMLAAMGARAAHLMPRAGLGLLPVEGPQAGGGPYYGPAGLIAVGEVTLFNRAELCAALAAVTAPPPSSDDATLLLHLYAHFGSAGLAMVSGMFAMAMLDGDELVLLRDPVGARTLFYARASGSWAAASALRALRRWPLLPARLNIAALRSFLTFAYLPGDETLLEGVYELEPGSILHLHADGSSRAEQYWQPCEHLDDPPAPAAHYAAELRRRLETITAAMLPGGEAAAVLLSGGVDSSLVTALAARLHDRPVHTYSINFGADLPNELAYSGLVANHCGTAHRVLTFNGHQIAAGLAETVALLDCPVGDPLTVPNLMLARAVAADGHRVLLNGEGGDPCFGGPKNLPMIAYELQRSNPAHSDRAEVYLHSYRKCYHELPRLLDPALLRALDDQPHPARLVQPYLQAPHMRSYLNRLLLTNVRTKGAHHILTKVERLTAAAGVEGRAPLFDRALVEYAFAIPPQYKLAGTAEKWILKQAVHDLLPPQIIERPKSGMRVPVQHWLHGPLRDLAYELLLGRRARARELFQTRTIKAWLRGDGMLWQRQGGALWLLLTLELWLRAYLDCSELDPAYFARRRNA